MVVYHVTSYKKLQKYLRSCRINAPVRAWETIDQAKRMSISTGRKIILRLKFRNDAPKLEGHFGLARVQNYDYELSSKSL